MTKPEILERVAQLLWEAQQVVDTHAPTYSPYFDRLDQRLTEFAQEMESLAAVEVR